MNKSVREIVEIDEDLCDGCGLCIPSCAEGAIQIVDGKARLVSENLCDGFGNCLGTCPQDAIMIIEREADEFDERAVEEHLGVMEEKADRKPEKPEPLPLASSPGGSGQSGHNHAFSGCPGSAMRMFEDRSAGEGPGERTATPSNLTQWPVQLMLVPPTAPFLRDREILLAADCCPFAYPDFHQKFLKGRALLVGCPKLDDLNHYRDKLEVIFRESGCSGVSVLVMEVPCCTGLEIVAREALLASGRDIPMNKTVIGIRGDILMETDFNRAGRSA